MCPSLCGPPLPTYHVSPEGSHFGFKPPSLVSATRHDLVAPTLASSTVTYPAFNTPPSHSGSIAPSSHIVSPAPSRVGSMPPPLVMHLSPHPPVVNPLPCPPMVDPLPHPLMVDSWPRPLVVDLSPCLPVVDPQPQPLAVAPLAKLEVVPPSWLMAHLSRSNDSVHLYRRPIRHMV